MWLLADTSPWRQDAGDHRQFNNSLWILRLAILGSTLRVVKLQWHTPLAMAPGINRLRTWVWLPPLLSQSKTPGKKSPGVCGVG